MRLDFSEFFTPGHELLRVDGCPYVLSKTRNVNLQDSQLRLTFMSDGAINLSVVGMDDDPQKKFKANNDLICACFKYANVDLDQSSNDKTQNFMAHIQNSYTVHLDSDVSVKRTFYIENYLTKYKNSEKPDFTDGIYIYYNDTPLSKPKKKKKK